MAAWEYLVLEYLREGWAKKEIKVTYTACYPDGRTMPLGESYFEYQDFTTVLFIGAEGVTTRLQGDEAQWRSVKALLMSWLGADGWELASSETLERIAHSDRGGGHSNAVHVQYTFKRMIGV